MMVFSRKQCQEHEGLKTFTKLVGVMDAGRRPGLPSLLRVVAIGGKRSTFSCFSTTQFPETVMESQVPATHTVPCVTEEEA